ncbi:isovaleryl-CoA dehydrogenase [Undibacterium sp. SXout11W]|uniref:isovaleryl-CoA dehydrogenase n=1 Tax=Undibacterium sp. SXout11W TaxID=3413050 RepID=UPI003BF1CB0F
MQWHTHEISNQVPELQDYNIFTQDSALMHAVSYFGADWQTETLQQSGELLGRASTLQLGELANRHLPELHTHNRIGERVDRVEFHPSWHQLLGLLRQQGLHAAPWATPKAGAHAARAAGYFMQAQVESGSLCPTTMTFAAIPVLKNEPVLFSLLKDKLFSNEHDANDIPIAQKKSILIGMGMTEKQGGSDVRTNTTIAYPMNNDGKEGRGEAYLLTGHKWFFSAPMCDAHLVLAKTEKGLSCFFVPRWRLDGSKNSIHIQRLKDKLGNKSNSSSEVEFMDAFGIMVGAEGRGVPTIIEMANLTRLDCVIGSAALMRQALSQAMHHARHRQAFGKLLIEQPLMRNVLCDLALESEAASYLMLKLAQALDHPDDPLQKAWKRILTPAAKFWICKRALEFTGECMEVWGGNGYVETGPMARLYREAPVNSIWEGSGNVMCLDVLRAIERDPEGMQLLIAELKASTSVTVRKMASDLTTDLSTTPEHQEMNARRFTQKLVLAAQSLLMHELAPTAIADAFSRSRYDAHGGKVYGTLNCAVSIELQQSILYRAFPPFQQPASP